MVNKYGNDFLNNIMWNKEYPFIPEVTNDNGLTIHEQDIVDIYFDGYRGLKLYSGRVYKIYDKDHIWIRFYSYRKHISNAHIKANELLPHNSNLPYPPNEVDSFNNGRANELEFFLSSVYGDLYYDELKLEDDWHFDDDKYENKRLMEVAKLKEKLKYKC